jgi:hypothetical protein
MSANIGSGGGAETFIRDRDWCFEFGAKLEENRTELGSRLRLGSAFARFG